MKLTGIHFLLTYQCNFECDHCFVWGSPRQTGIFTLSQIEDVLQQAEAVGTVRSIYFEGGEPFLYYPILLKAVKLAADYGHEVGIVSNGYWATTAADAREWLQPFVGTLQDLSVSSDLFHYDELLSKQARNACQLMSVPAAWAPSAMPFISSRYSASMRCANWSTAAWTKNSHGLPVSQ